ERLDAHAVAHEMQAPLGAVPQREGEHAHEALDRGVETPCLKGGKNDFRIGVSAPGRSKSAALQLFADRQKVVDLAVEDDREAAGGGLHRLMTGRREIDDREAPESERDAGGGIRPD